MSDDVIIGLTRRELGLWSLIIVSLLGSGASGYRAYTGTQDRYYSQDAAKDFQIRDERIHRNTQDITELEQDYDFLRENIPPPEVRKELDDHEARIRLLEKR